MKDLYEQFLMFEKAGRVFVWENAIKTKKEVALYANPGKKIIWKDGKRKIYLNSKCGKKQKISIISEKITWQTISNSVKYI